MFHAVISAVPAVLPVDWDGSKASVTIMLAANDDERLRVALEVRLWPGR